MYQRPPLTFRTALRHLRRNWFIPVVAVIGGAVMASLLSSSDATVETTVRLTSSPALALLDSTTDTGLTADELATQLIAGVPEYNITKDGEVSISARPNSLLIVVSKSSVEESMEVSARYVEAARALRQAHDQAASKSILASVDVARERLQEYLANADDSPAGGVITSRTDVVTRLADLDVVAGVAGQLAVSDGGVMAASIDKTSGTLTETVLGALALGSLAVVGVLVLSPMSGRIRSADDLEGVVRGFGAPPVFSAPGGAMTLETVARVAQEHDPSLSIVPLRGAERVLGDVAETYRVTSELPRGISELGRGASVILVAKRGTSTIEQLEDACRALEAARVTIGAVGLAG